MKLHTLAILLGGAALGLLLTPHSAAESAFAAKLSEIARSGNIDALLVKASSPATAEDLGAALDWLKIQAVSGQGGARFIYTYAYDLWRAGVKDSSAAMLMYAMLTIRVDAARCADPTSYPDKIGKWESQLTHILDYFRKLEPAAKEKFLRLALDLEEKNKAREKDVWLGSGGLSFMRRFQQKHGELKGTEVNDPSKIGGKTILLEDDTIQPEFISDAEWAGRRQTVRAEFKRKMLE